MRMIRTLASGAVGLLALTGCSQTIHGSATPAEDIVGPVAYADFDIESAKGVLLTTAEIPSGYDHISDSDLDYISGLGQTGDPEDVVINPPECAEFYNQGTPAGAGDLIEAAALRAFTTGTTPSDIGVIMEAIGPQELFAAQVGWEIPDACQDMTMELDGEEVAVSISDLPVDIGSQSTGMELTMTAPGVGFELSMSMVAVSEPNGGLMVMAVGDDSGDVVEIAQIAYDKAEDFLT